MLTTPYTWELDDAIEANDCDVANGRMLTGLELDKAEAAAHWLDDVIGDVSRNVDAAVFGVEHSIAGINVLAK